MRVLAITLPFVDLSNPTKFEMEWISNKKFRKTIKTDNLNWNDIKEDRLSFSGFLDFSRLCFKILPLGKMNFPE